MYIMSMDFKEKQIVIEYLLGLTLRQKHDLMVQEGGQNLNNLINEALDRLSVEGRLIFENDFLVKKDKLWYLEYFSKSTYYRIKNESMSTFLNCLGL